MQVQTKDKCKVKSKNIKSHHCFHIQVICLINICPMILIAIILRPWDLDVDCLVIADVYIRDGDPVSSLFLRTTEPNEGTHCH